MGRLPVLDQVAALDIPLDRDRSLRTLIEELAGALEDIVGLREASRFFTAVGRAMGDQIDRDSRTALGAKRLSREQVTAVLVDLKRRIGGGAVAAENLGCAKVELGETIAQGDPGRRVVVYPRPAPESVAGEGRDYVRPA